MYVISRIITTVLFVWTILQHIHRSSADESDIDPEHLKDYPYCGVMKEPTDDGTGRGVNSEDSTEDYRWVVLLIRQIDQKGGSYNSFCTGTVITDR